MRDKTYLIVLGEGGGESLLSPLKKVLDYTWASGLVMGFGVGQLRLWWADRLRLDDWAYVGRMG
jgi:hypothetical protein